MRFLGVLVPLCLASLAGAAPSSNPAFLGIKMSPHRGGCQIDGTTPGSSASEAGLREWDLVVAIDGVATPTCDVLHAQIVKNAPGHVVKLDVRRGADRIVVAAPLTTRAEVLHRRLVGQSMEAFDVIDADDSKRTYDLSESRGKTTVVGFFMLQRCTGCSAVFDRVADGVAKRLAGSDVAPTVLAVTQEPISSVAAFGSSAPTVTQQVLHHRRSFGFTASVPLAIASEDTFAELAIDDPLRIHFMVIDCRGIVRFVAPIAPDSDDIEAAVDEVLAAVVQAEHLRTQRR